jgi:hypothetical protein
MTLDAKDATNIIFSMLLLLLLLVCLVEKLIISF